VPFIRRYVAEELRQRMAGGEPLDDTLTWLGKTGATVGDAVDLLEEAGLTREYAEHALTTHPDWEPLIRLLGGTAGEQSP